ncbi:alpha/beta hydrolase [Lactobacillus salsicarnum]|nr:alpha/beta hydrolase [Companilactobacillus mishanensis]MQS89773.1 alpha/beta hydrolase [Companilactobacillus mishanensis]
MKLSQRGELIMKKKITAFLIAFVSLVSLICVTQFSNVQTSKAATTSDPIFFVPGSYSDQNSWDSMYQQLDPSNVHPVVKLNVAPNGAVTRTDVRAGNPGERPFVTVAFDNILWNDDAVYANAAGLQSAIQSYQAKDPFTHDDFVAQSNGGNIVTRYMEAYPSTACGTFITVGTPYNMRANNGDPADPLLISQAAGAGRLNPSMKVYNVIGRNGDDTSTDTVVARESAMDGSHIFPGHTASLTYLYLSGEDAIHCNQVSAPQMAQIISKYIDLN